MGFDYSFRWIAAFKALPDMLVGTWYTLQTTFLSMSVDAGRRLGQSATDALGHADRHAIGCHLRPGVCWLCRQMWCGSRAHWA